VARTSSKSRHGQVCISKAHPAFHFCIYTKDLKFCIMPRRSTPYLHESWFPFRHFLRIHKPGNRWWIRFLLQTEICLFKVRSNVGPSETLKRWQMVLPILNWRLDGWSYFCLIAPALFQFAGIRIGGMCFDHWHAHCIWIVEMGGIVNFRLLV
jgi:hypothetical protein